MSFSPTPDQAKLLGFIKAQIAERGFAPTFEEMREHMGLSHRSGIHRLVTGLEGRGLIRRQFHKARAIEVLAE